MSLAVPTNLANRDDVQQIVLSLLESLPGPVTYHIFDGKPATTAIHPDEFSMAATTIANCSIIYALDGIRSIREPIAGFVANKKLKTAHLVHLIDDRPPTGTGRIQRRTMGMLAVYIRYIFAEFEWVDRLTVPSNIEMNGEMFDLRVTSDDISTITLTDEKHRPKSSRPFGR